LRRSRWRPGGGGGGRRRRRRGGRRLAGVFLVGGGVVGDQRHRVRVDDGCVAMGWVGFRSGEVIVVSGPNHAGPRCHVGRELNATELLLLFACKEQFRSGHCSDRAASPPLPFHRQRSTVEQAQVAGSVVSRPLAFGNQSILVAAHQSRRAVAVQTAPWHVS
jgi:hypothetical protein